MNPLLYYNLPGCSYFVLSSERFEGTGSPIFYKDMDGRAREVKALGSGLHPVMPQVSSSITPTAEVIRVDVSAFVLSNEAYAGPGGRLCRMDQPIPLAG